MKLLEKDEIKEMFLGDKKPLSRALITNRSERFLLFYIAIVFSILGYLFVETTFVPGMRTIRYAEISFVCSMKIFRFTGNGFVCNILRFLFVLPLF